MNLKDLHTENKLVPTQLMFLAEEGKVISMQIESGEQVKEHITKVPALLVCISGDAVFQDENGNTIELKSGDYVNIKPNLKHWVDANEDSNLLIIK
jgi:quercetin dioxygenase-like cupin family protein